MYRIREHNMSFQTKFIMLFVIELMDVFLTVFKIYLTPKFTAGGSFINYVTYISWFDYPSVPLRHRLLHSSDTIPLVVTSHILQLLI